MFKETTQVASLAHLLELYESGKVQRWHTMRGVDPQTNADHSWGVALLILMQWPEASNKLIKAALLHDCGERASGDIPSTAKDFNPALRTASKTSEAAWLKAMGVELPELNQAEKTILTIADHQEAWLHLNSRMKHAIIDNAMSRLNADILEMLAGQEGGSRA